jgi:hypothetical protein
MTECTVCQGRSNNGFLCARCCGELRTLLDGLSIGNPLGNGRRSRPLLVCLADSALGDTRQGESERRSSDRTTPLPFHDGSSMLLDAVHATLVRWVQDICDTHHIEYSGVHVVAADFIGPLPAAAVRDGLHDTVRVHADPRTTRSAAIWLKHHIARMALSEDAEMFYREIKDVSDAIGRMIWPEASARFLGPCPVVLTNNYGDQVCGRELTAAREERYVQCPSCKTTHHVPELHGRQMDTTDEMSFTITQLHRMILPINREDVPLRTLQHWAASGRLIPTGHDADGDPRFLLKEVRELREAKAQKAPTGAAAEKYKRKAG